MATHEEQLFWREQLPLFYRQANAPKITKGLQAASYNDYAPIPRSSSRPSPLITLPVELLYKIFAFARYDHYGGNESAYVALVNPAHLTKLVQICRYWRVLALSDPTLWATIIAMDSKPCELQRVRLWLARTGATCPLSLRLGASLEPINMEDIMKLFLSQVHRWQKISFEFTSSDISALQLLAQLPQGSAPQLKSIYMANSQPDLLEEIMHQAWTSLCTTLSLKVVFVNNDHMPRIPWHQLTQLSLRSISAQAILDTLGHCQSLEYLDISYPFQRGLPQCSSPVVLPSLRSLYLYTEMNTAPLLDCLTTPALLNLHVKQKEWAGLKPRPASLHDFLHRSKCSLQVLEFSDFALSEAEFLQYIQSPLLSTVTSVVLTGFLSDVVVAALTVGVSGSSTDTAPLFPSIRRLELRLCKTSKAGLLERMVLSRLETGILKRVQLSVTGNHISGDFVSDITKRFDAEILVYGD